VRTFVYVVVIGVSASFAVAQNNQPPSVPQIIEPRMPGKIVYAGDVHLATSVFADPNVNDTHACSDWEIWSFTAGERVWAALCAMGTAARNARLSDGAFENSLAGQSELAFGQVFLLRVRHKDSSGDAATEWSPFASRSFQTGAESLDAPLAVQDILPGARWTDGDDLDVILPVRNGSRMRLESPTGATLVEFLENDGVTNLITNPPALPVAVAVRVRIDAGTIEGDLTLPASTVRFNDSSGRRTTVYLPGVTLAPAATALLWIERNGSAYIALPEQTQPEFSSLIRANPVPWIALQKGYVVEPVAGGFQLPVSIAFVAHPGLDPDSPLFYVGEQYGAIKVVTRDGTTSDYETGLLDFTPSGRIPGDGEEGLAALVVEPTTGDLFATTLAVSVANPPDPIPTVVRLSSTDGGRTSSSLSVVFQAEAPMVGPHQVSNVSIGPDGFLYVHVGDSFNESDAQDLDSVYGKILRMNLDGTPANTNPFFNDADGIGPRDFVFASGLRNPFGGAWRAADQSLYELESGPDVDRLAKVVAGRDYGWSGGIGGDLQMQNFAVYNWTPYVEPLNLAFIQEQTFAGSGFPTKQWGHAFVTESGPTWATGTNMSGKRISELTLGDEEDILRGPIPFVAYNGSGKATVAAVAAGVDGLYFSDLYKDTNTVSPTDVGANVFRVRFVGAVDFTADYSEGAAPSCVRFTDTSTLPGVVDWLWDFGDGTFSSEQNPLHVYQTNGRFSVRLLVVSPAGFAVEQKNQFVSVGSLGRLAMIANSPLSTFDAAVFLRLLSRGYDVDLMEDDVALRPSGVDLAKEFDLIVLSSTAAPGNIMGEFRDLPVPILFWDSALLSVASEPLTAMGSVMLLQSSINVLAVDHPVTSGLTPGVLAVASAPTVFNYGTGAVGTGVQVLAQAAGDPQRFAVLAIEEGGALLNERTAPARRVFLPFESSASVGLTAEGIQLLDQAVDWAIRPSVSPQGDSDSDGDVDLLDLGLQIAALSGPDVAAQQGPCGDGDLDGDGDVDLFDFSVLQNNYSPVIE